MRSVGSIVLITITNTLEFSASHRLSRRDWSEEKNREIFGKCASPAGHGHNYSLEVSIVGQPDHETGLILETSKLRALIEQCGLSELAQSNLDSDVAWLKGRLTTIETLVEEIWKRLEPAVRRSRSSVRLSRLKLCETSRIYATREET